MNVEGNVLATKNSSKYVPSTVTKNISDITLPTINIVERNSSLYTQRYIIEAETSSNIQHTIGLTTKSLVEVVD